MPLAEQIDREAMKALTGAALLPGGSAAGANLLGAPALISIGLSGLGLVLWYVYKLYCERHRHVEVSVLLDRLPQQVSTSDAATLARALAREEDAQPRSGAAQGAPQVGATPSSRAASARRARRQQ
jgi:hypothetical protein